MDWSSAVDLFLNSGTTYNDKFGATVYTIPDNQEAINITLLSNIPNKNSLLMTNLHLLIPTCDDPANQGSRM